MNKNKRYKRSLDKTKRILVIEDGSVNFGIGSEVLAKLIEGGIHFDFAKRIGSEPYPIPSENELELQILPTIASIVAEVLVLKNGAL